MNTILNNNILHLSASSPEEFEQQIIENKKNNPNFSSFISLSIYDPRTILSPFEVEDISVDKIAPHILSEVTELTSLPVDELRFDYQIFDDEKSVIKGLYICSKKFIIDSYLQIAYQNQISLIKITDGSIGFINQIFKTGADLPKNFVIIDNLQRSYINLLTFQNNKCNFVRKIPYETIEEVKDEVVQSIRCAYSNSSAKKFDKIYFTNDLPKYSRIINEIKTAFSSETAILTTANSDEKKVNDDDFFGLNLVKHNSLSINRRKVIASTVWALLIILIIPFTVNAFHIYQNHENIKKIKSTYTNAEYEQAKKTIKKAIQL